MTFKIYDRLLPVDRDQQRSRFEQFIDKTGNDEQTAVRSEDDEGPSRASGHATWCYETRERGAVEGDRHGQAKAYKAAADRQQTYTFPRYTGATDENRWSAGETPLSSHDR